VADSCSGAAKCIQALFEELNGLGYQCRIVSGTVTDGKSDMLEKALSSAATQSMLIAGTKLRAPLRKIRLHGVEHIIAGNKATAWPDLRSYEDSMLREVFLENFNELKPDVVLTYGGFASNFFAGQHAMANGRRSVLFAASDTYNQISDFIHVNTIAAVSNALRTRLARVVKLPTVVLASLVKTSDAKCLRHNPEFITLLNPILAKGLKLATAIAAECLRLKKPYKFLFVESRGTRETALHACPELEHCANVAFARNSADIRSIYERTKIILYPSVWFETAGQTLIEANANGIPVLASNVGGIADMLDGAGFLFDLPRAMLEKWDSPAPAEYIATWIAIIDRLHDDPAALNDAIKRAYDADKRYDLKGLAQKFAAAVA
jgi:hypothetical protein